MDNESSQRWKVFGAWLKKERERTHKSQKEVAALTRLHAVHVSRIETGDTGIKQKTLDLLIEALKLNKEEAYRQAGFWPGGSLAEPVEVSSEAFGRQLQIVIQAFNDLSPPEQKRLLKVLIISFGEPADLGDRAFEISDHTGLSGEIDQVSIPSKPIAPGKVKP